MKRRDFLVLGCAAAVSPLTAHAQQKATRVIGILGDSSPDGATLALAGFRQGLGENGYIEGQNLRIEYRWANGNFGELPALATDLVERKVDLIATMVGGPSTHAAKSATSTVPVVFSVGVDPVATGLVASLAHPGGNLTGTTVFGTVLTLKRLELLCGLVPQAKAIFLLTNPNNPATPPTYAPSAALQEAARTMGVVLNVLRAGSEAEIDAAFSTVIEQPARAMLVYPDPLFDSRVAQLTRVAAHRSIPAMYARREYVSAGGLVSYGTNIPAMYRLTGIYAAQVLDGAKPADLPVQQPTKFELVVNLKAAATLGLTIPQSILARADEVVE